MDVEVFCGALIRSVLICKAEKSYGGSTWLGTLRSRLTLRGDSCRVKPQIRCSVGT